MKRRDTTGLSFEEWLQRFCESLAEFPVAKHVLDNLASQGGSFVEAAILIWIYTALKPLPPAKWAGSLEPPGGAKRFIDDLMSCSVAIESFNRSEEGQGLRAFIRRVKVSWPPTLSKLRYELEDFERLPAILCEYAGWLNAEISFWRGVFSEPRKTKTRALILLFRCFEVTFGEAKYSDLGAVLVPGYWVTGSEKDATGEALAVRNRLDRFRENHSSEFEEWSKTYPLPPGTGAVLALLLDFEPGALERFKHNAAVSAFFRGQ